MKVDFQGHYDTDTGMMTVDIGRDWDKLLPELKPGFNVYTWQVDGMSFLRFARGGQKPPIDMATGFRTDG